MIEWIKDFIDKVNRFPERYNKCIKNQCRLIEELLSRKDIQYKENDPIAFEKFCRLFTHQKGDWAGKPFELDDVQKFAVACVMGIKYYDTKYNMWLRYFRHFNLFVARKWGKSFFASAFILWFLKLDKENGAEVKIIAENKEQSSRLFKTVLTSIKTNPILMKCFKKRHNKDTCADEIYCKDENDMDCVFTYESGRTIGHDGDSNNLIVCDEAEEVTKFEQYQSKVTGQGARKQPLTLVISTAGILPDSLYEELYNRNNEYLEKKKYAKDCRIFALMFGLDFDDDIDDVSKWVKANPALIDYNRPNLDYLKSQYENAKNDPVALSSFVAKHLNRQVGAISSFYDRETIKKCMTIVTKDMFYDTYATGGVDLSSTTDLCCATAKILLENGKSIILQAYFVASECMERNSKKDRQDYKIFVDMNTENEITAHLVIVTQGTTVDYRAVTRWFVDLRDNYKINFLKIGYDKAMANYWIADMVENGFAHEKVEFDKNNRVESRDDGVLTPCYQGKGLDEAIRLSRTLFELGKYVVDKNNKLLPYCFWNVKVTADNDNKLSVSKLKSTGHIDGCVGVFNSEVAYKRAKEIYQDGTIGYLFEEKTEEN